MQESDGAAGAAAVEEPPKDPLDDVDAKLWTGRYNFVSMLDTWFLLGFLSILLIGGTIYLALYVEALSNYQYYIWLSLALVLLLMWGLPICRAKYKQMSYKYELTDDRLIHWRGIFSIERDQIDIIKISDMTCKQGLLQRMAQVGTIRIQSNDESHPELLLEGIKDVHKVYDKINAVRKKERDKKERVFVSRSESSSPGE